MKKIVSFALCLILMAALAFPVFAEGPAEEEEAPDAFLENLDQEYYGRFRDQDVSINVYNWGEYISNGEDDSLDVNAAFEKLTGIKVNYTNYATNEEMYAKLRSGWASYDVIIPSEYMIARMISEDMLEPLDLDNIPGRSHIDPSMVGMSYDPTAQYSVPYTWGTVVLIYNTKMVSPDTDVNTWNLLWNEDYAGQILMFNNPRDAFGIALKKAGYSLNPENVDQIKAAAEELKKQKPLVMAYVMDEIFDKMGAGEAAIAPYYAGDAITMISENPDLAAAVPREGTNIFVDAMCIPKGSKNKEAAEMYINFHCEPEVAAANTEYIGYSTPNLEALELLDEELRNNEIAYPPAEILEKTEYFVELPDELNKAIDENWKDTLSDDENFSYWLVPGLIVLALIACVVIVVRRNAKKQRQSY